MSAVDEWRTRWRQQIEDANRYSLRRKLGDRWTVCKSCLHRRSCSDSKCSIVVDEKGESRISGYTEG